MSAPNKICTYDQWEKEQKISSSSPESYYAELAWNAALDRLLESVFNKVDSCKNNFETNDEVELYSKITNLMTGFKS